MVLIIYVDDILLTGKNLKDISDVKAFLNSEFSIKDLGEADFFLGIQIHQSEKVIDISQHKYIQGILLECNLMNAKSYDTSFPTAYKISKTDGVPLSNPSKYRRLIGQLLYLTVTRPDITFAIQQLSQFMSQPTGQHWKLGLRVFKYLKGTHCL